MGWTLFATAQRVSTIDCVMTFEQNGLKPVHDRRKNERSERHGRQHAHATAAAQFQANLRAQQQMQQDNLNATLRAMTPAPYVPQMRTTTCIPIGNMISCSRY
jgi:hypothetical protein